MLVLMLTVKRKFILASKHIDTSFHNSNNGFLLQKAFGIFLITTVLLIWGFGTSLTTFIFSTLFICSLW